MARIARSLGTLRLQVDAQWPNRDKSNDGWIGDAAHAATNSDHNPNAAGVVTALDITNDPAHGLVARKLAETLLASRDPRIKYIISNAQIASSLVSPWVWRPYTGANAHRAHVHISVMADPQLYDNTRSWQIGGATIPDPIPPPPPATPGRFSNIIATEFGGASDFEKSAYDDHLITDTELGVSLPATVPSPRPKVRVIKGNKSVVCPIIDKGPWNTNDPYWLHGARPQAETGTDTRGRHTNKAGIDLTPATMDALGVSGKHGTRSTTVDWEFVTAAAPQPVPPPLPIPTPTPTPEEVPMDIFKLLPLLMRILQLLPQIQEAMRSGTSVLALLQKFAPDLISIVQGVGGALFPNLPAPAQVEAGALAAFDQVQVRWIQTSLNTLNLATPPLEVDGQYGFKTKTVVAAFQTAHNIVADGWAGKVTSAAIQTELNKLTAATVGVPAAPVT